MARILGIMGSARKDGYTVKVLQEALEGICSVSGVEAELVCLLDYDFGPCRSCYECIRMAEHRCVRKDDMGERGQGRLWRKVEAANGLILATPVHFPLAGQGQRPLAPRHLEGIPGGAAH